MATLIVITAPREIGREWRLIIAGERAIAGSQYAVGGSKCIERGCPDEVRSFAEAMLGEVHWRPDPIFTMDIAESAGRPWLVELNGFSCSWLYECDLASVVAEASRLATRAWEGVTRPRAGP